MKIEQLTNRIQEFWFVLIDSDVVTTVLDFLTNAVSLATNLVDTLGTVPSIFGVIGASVGTYQSIKGGGRAKNIPLICSIKEVNYSQKFSLVGKLLTTLS